MRVLYFFLATLITPFPFRTVVFQLSYLIAFPIYAIYVRNFQKTKHRRQRVDRALKSADRFSANMTYQGANLTDFEFILLFLWGLTASGVATLIGVDRL